jgi:hypothetical protein
MFPPMPSSGESEHDRFKRFAKAILAVPKAEAPPAGEAIPWLKAEKEMIEGDILTVRSEIDNRKKRLRRQCSIPHTIKLIRDLQ